jgi:hypothetical protein
VRASDTPVIPKLDRPARSVPDARDIGDSLTAASSSRSAAPASPEEMAEFLGSMLDATRADISAAYRSRQAGGRREVDLHRGALRLTDGALVELREHIARLAGRFGERDTPGVWTRVVIALVDLQDRPPPDATTRPERTS